MKSDRHSAIRDLLVKTTAASRVTNQDELRRKLAGKGFHVTQATLSRDIHELKLSKGPNGYALPAHPADNDDDDQPAIRAVLENFGLEARQAANLIVVITRTGGAQPVAATIDYEEWPEVIGTIAGDDTVLVICQNPRKALAVKHRIEAHIA
ncbi:MAG: ArgR family transcriptional regulator [Acidobacteriaceae bacterium]